MIVKIYNPDNLPVIQPLPEPQKKPSDGAIAICGQCGMRIFPVMGYVCPNASCPVFMKSTC